MLSQRTKRSIAALAIACLAACGGPIDPPAPSATGKGDALANSLAVGELVAGQVYDRAFTGWFSFHSWRTMVDAPLIKLMVASRSFVPAIRLSYWRTPRTGDTPLSQNVWITPRNGLTRVEGGDGRYEATLLVARRPVGREEWRSLTLQLTSTEAMISGGSPTADQRYEISVEPVPTEELPAHIGYSRDDQVTAGWARPPFVEHHRTEGRVHFELESPALIETVAAEVGDSTNKQPTLFVENLEGPVEQMYEVQQRMSRRAEPDEAAPGSVGFTDLREVLWKGQLRFGKDSETDFLPGATEDLELRGLTVRGHPLTTLRGAIDLRRAPYESLRDLVPRLGHWDGVDAVLFSSIWLDG